MIDFIDKKEKRERREQDTFSTHFLDYSRKIHHWLHSPIDLVKISNAFDHEQKLHFLYPFSRAIET